MNNSSTTAISAINISSHNTMVGNSIGGNGATVTNAFSFDSTSQFNVGPSYDNAIIATNAIVDASGLNGGFFPTAYKIQELAGDNELGSGTTAAIQTGAGSGASAGLATGSNDTTGIITINTGTSPSASASLVHLNFSSTKLKTPVLILTPANAAAVGLGVSTAAIGKTGVNISSGTSAPAATTAYIWNYMVVGLDQ